MADCDCSPTEFVGVCKNAYYFEGPQCAAEDELDKCIEEDRFLFSQDRMKLLRCHDNKFLILSYNGVFEKQNLTASGQDSSDNKFNLRFYNSDVDKEGIPVMLYATKSDKKLVVCCDSNGGIHPEEIEIQDTIDASKDKALFYMIHQGISNKYMFESSWCENRYLGFEPDEENPSVVKLVLREYNQENQEDVLSPE